MHPVHPYAPGHREVDTLRGISLPPVSRDGTGIHTGVHARPKSSSVGTAVVLTMLGATLTATFGFMAVGSSAEHGHAARSTARAAAVAAAAPRALEDATSASAAAAEAGKRATIIAPPPAPVPVGIADVLAPEGSNVFVDDSFMGVAPIHVTAPMGMHTVKIESASSRGDFRTVDVVFGEDPVEVTLDQAALAAPTAAAPAAAPVRASSRAHAPGHVTGHASPRRTPPAKARAGASATSASEMQQAKALQAQAAAATADSL